MRGQSLLVLALLLAAIISPGHFTASTANEFEAVTDRAFNGGKVQTDSTVEAITPVGDFAYDGALQSDGKLVVVGQTIPNVGGSLDSQLARSVLLRYEADGSLDSSFGPGGGIVRDLFGVRGEARAVAIQADGRIVVGGFSSGLADPANGRSEVNFALVRYNTDGSPDTGFGVSGKVITDFTHPQSSQESLDRVFDIVIQPDGKIIAAGGSFQSSQAQFALARYNSDGSPDEGFGAGGKVLVQPGSFIPKVSASVQTDGKILIAGSYNEDFVLIRLNPNGTPDHGFGAGGVVQTDIGGRLDLINDVAVLPDGGILAAGFSDNGNSINAEDISLARYGSNGALDPAFGSGGKVRFGIAGRSLKANGMKVQPDGKVVVAGAMERFNFYSDFALLRFNQNGSIDSSFGDRGKVVSDFSGDQDAATQVLIQADGKIISIGSAFRLRTQSDFAIVRHGADGRFDPGFGGGGKAWVDFNHAADAARDVVVQPDGKIIVVGTTQNNTEPDNQSEFVLVRFDPNGLPDASFGDGGTVRTDFGNSYDNANAVALQADGKIVVAGGRMNSDRTVSEFAVARYNADGSLDATFGNGGMSTIDIGPDTESASDVALQSDGKIVLAGSITVANPGPSTFISDFAVARFNSDGTVDTGFGSGGSVATDFSNENDTAESVAIQTDGKIIAGGFTTVRRQSSSEVCDFAMARYNSDGQLDTSFGNNGKVASDLFGSDDRAHGMALQPDGKILLAGETFFSDSSIDFGLARYNSDGTPDLTFGSGGKTHTDFDNSVDVAHSMDIQRDGKIILGGFTNGFASYDFAIARYTRDGIPDDDFGPGGRAFVDFYEDNDFGYGITSQADGKIIMVGEADLPGTWGPDIGIARLAGSKNADTTGVFRPTNGALYLKNSNATGFADLFITYGIPGDAPVTGDWDGDGIDTIGVYRDGTFFLRNSNTNGFADVVATFGMPGDQPVAGDWDGDGIDTIGTYRNGVFLLRNSNTSGDPEVVFGLGVPGDVGIAGDWDGDGVVTTGIFRTTDGALYLKNTNATGFADIVLTYGLPGDKPVPGDWDGDGVDTIGVYRQGTFFLRNSNTNGFADLVFSLGIDGDFPVAGDWNGLP